MKKQPSGGKRLKEPKPGARVTFKKQSLQEFYTSTFKFNPFASDQDGSSLEQPSQLKVVESTTTYGVCESPVR